ncbi:hypothetical protein H9L39_17605 [Fusarium oxysporum f. sp. albedinis]|nr:hypothetical protein H9L39_17605 [Fusarium oxysporum f. sp. albedinis]
MTDKERAALDPNSREHFNRVWGSKIQVIGWSFYAFILWALKVCVTTFYGRLTYVFPAGFGSNAPRRAWAPLADFDIATQVRIDTSQDPFAFKILLSCQPMHKFWQINPDPGTLCKPTNSPAYVLVVVIPNVLTDAYLLYIPLSLGLEGAVSGSSWACRETFVAIVVTNLPIIQPLLRMGSRMMGLKGLFSSQTNTAGESHQLRSSEPGRSRFGTSRGRERPPRHPLSAPQATAWGSDEYILREDSDGKNSGRTDDSGGIEITQEINVRLEEVPAANPRDTTPPAANDWGFKTEVRKKPRAVRGLRLASY